MTVGDPIDSLASCVCVFRNHFRYHREISRSSSYGQKVGQVPEVVTSIIPCYWIEQSVYGNRHWCSSDRQRKSVDNA